VPALLPFAEQSNVASPLRFYLALTPVPGGVARKRRDDAMADTSIAARMGG
jgi:hypothetical protein